MDYLSVRGIRRLLLGTTYSYGRQVSGNSGLEDFSMQPVFGIGVSTYGRAQVVDRSPKDGVPSTGLARIGHIGQERKVHPILRVGNLRLYWMAFFLSVFLCLHLVIYLSSAGPSMAVQRNFIQHCRASSITTLYVLALDVLRTVGVTAAARAATNHRAASAPHSHAMGRPRGAVFSPSPACGLAPWGAAPLPFS
jgi:hypothetical protein